MKISLPETLLLLALDQKGTNPHSYQTAYLYSVAGGVLLELLLAQKVAFQADKRILSNPNIQLNDEILDEANKLCSIPNKTIYSVKYKKDSIAETPIEWIKVIYQVPHLHKKYYQRLTEKNIISQQRKKVLGIFPYTIRLVENTALKAQIIQRLKQIIDFQATPSPKELMLLSLIKTSNLTKTVFGLKASEVKATEERIQEILQKKYDYQEIDDSLRIFLEEDMEKYYETLDSLADAIDAIGDAIGDAGGGDGGGDGGDGGGD